MGAPTIICKHQLYQAALSEGWANAKDVRLAFNQHSTTQDQVSMQIQNTKKI